MAAPGTAAHDAASDDDSSSSYSSVSGDSLPSIHAYGHTYHGSARLYVPNDADEDRRLTLQHELWKLCLGGRLHDARLPIENPTFGMRTETSEEDDSDSDSASDSASDSEGGDEAPTSQPQYHILDVGSGNGLWAVEAARRYPNASVLSLDMTSALLPKPPVPANLTFEIRDVAEPWPPALYDFIHVRNLVGGGVRDWEWFLAQCLSHLKPGGSIEFSELRPRFYDVDPAQAAMPEGEQPVIGAACLEYMRLFADTCRSRGVDFDPTPRAAEYLMSSGAEMVRERVHWIPVKQWGNDAIMRRRGELLNDIVDVGLENWTLMLFGKEGRDEAETRALLKQVMAEVRDPRTRSYFNLTIITARKPMG